MQRGLTYNQDIFKVITARPMQLADENYKTIAALYNYIKDKDKIRFKYTRRGEAGKRLMSPYRIIYDDGFKQPLNERFPQKLMLQGVTPKDIKSLNNNTDFESLSRLAIDFSDGVIQGSETVNSNVKEYAIQKGIPFLDYQPEDNYVDAFNEFYDKILS